MVFSWRTLAWTALITLFSFAIRGATAQTTDEPQPATAEQPADNPSTPASTETPPTPTADEENPAPPAEASAPKNTPAAEEKPAAAEEKPAPDNQPETPKPPTNPPSAKGTRVADSS